MKIFVLPPGEDWIVDRMTEEWYQHNTDISTRKIEESDMIWLLADWCWRRIDTAILKKKKVVTTVHHIVPEKFDNFQKKDFKDRDVITDIYHVFNERTYAFIRPLTSKPIVMIPYWANQNLWSPKNISKKEIRKALSLPEDAWLVGSFQRDTEGRDNASPKLEKGPDLLVDAIEKWKNQRDDLHVLLSGWRRQYVMKRLDASNVPYTYIEKPSNSKLADLYQSLDLYAVTARYEGGPQALIECGLMNTNVVSRPVGIAEQLLPLSAINNDITLAIPAVPFVNAWKIPLAFENYRKVFSALVEES